MAKVMIGNASAITVPREDRDSIRKFYCDVLGGKIVKQDNEKDILRLEDDFFILFRYSDVPDESEFLRTPRALWLQLKTENVEEMTRKILDFGARKMDIPSGLPEDVPYLYFQAPGGQCFQLLPINENQSYYKGAKDGRNVAELTAADARKEKAISEWALGHFSTPRPCKESVMSSNTAIKERSLPATAPVGHNGVGHDMQNHPVAQKHGFAAVNGLSIYYEIEGAGKPLVYIPMGFGVAGTTKFPTLARDRMLISLDLQGRGRTADIDRPLSYEQQADDVIALLQHLGIGQTDLLGECVGGIVATLVAMRRPDLVGRIITHGTVFGQFHAAYKSEILAHVMSLTPDSEVLRFQRERYERVAPDPAHWPALFAKFNSTEWQGFAPAALGKVQAPVLVAVGNHDWVRLEHALDIHRLFPKGEFAVIPAMIWVPEVVSKRMLRQAE